MDILDIFHSLPAIGLYAETHYRFKYFPLSLYYRRQPEIIFDTPHRLEPNQALPVFLIVKDANRYPIEISSVKITVEYDGQILVFDYFLNERIASPFWYRTFDIDVSSLPGGLISVNGQVVIRIDRKTIVVENDNHKGLTHKPLSVYKSEQPLPNLPGWTAGELHCHTSYGCDQVEFGAPPGAYQRAAEAMGLQWVALTDHSYNLDDQSDDYLKTDPELKKWHRFQAEVEELNRGDCKVLLIPGEELTCSSKSGKNVHLLVLGNRQFLHGSGDSAEQWLNTKSELSVSNALSAIDRDSIAIAAHPFSKVGLFQRRLVHREEWNLEDLMNSRLDGWQINNGLWDEGFRRGLRVWVRSLKLPAEKIPVILGGNDAHGNLNRFRQVKMPMIRLCERDSHIFGRITTRLKTDKFDTTGIFQAIRTGNAAISDGPAMEINLHHLPEGHLDTNDHQYHKLTVNYLTTPEFGRIETLDVLAGNLRSKGRDKLEEEVLFQLNEDKLTDRPYQGEITLNIEAAHYVRTQMSTRTASGKFHHCYSNPTFISS